MKREIKGFLVGVLITIAVLLTCSPAFSAGITETIKVIFNGISINVNGVAIKSDNILYNGKTYVPLRTVSEALEKDVLWNKETSEVDINDKFVQDDIVQGKKDYFPKVLFSVNDKMFPPIWRTDKYINPEAEAIEEFEKERANEIIQYAYKKYPAHMLRRYLSEVYVLKSLKFYGLKYGGTSDNDTVYTVMDNFNFTEKAFHHEFASILFHQNSNVFNYDEFVDNNPTGFNYLGSGIMALNDEECIDKGINEEYCKDGFLMKYSKSAFEEDFCTIAEYLFTNGPGFWDAVKKYPKLKRKVDLIIQFYNLYDNVFTEDYFKSLK